MGEVRFGLCAPVVVVVVGGGSLSKQFGCPITGHAGARSLAMLVGGRLQTGAHVTQLAMLYRSAAATV